MCDGVPIFVGYSGLWYWDGASWNLVSGSVGVFDDVFYFGLVPVRFAPSGTKGIAVWGDVLYGYNRRITFDISNVAGTINISNIVQTNNDYYDTEYPVTYSDTGLVYDAWEVTYSPPSSCGYPDPDCGGGGAVHDITYDDSIVIAGHFNGDVSLEGVDYDLKRVCTTYFYCGSDPEQYFTYEIFDDYELSISRSGSREVTRNGSVSEGPYCIAADFNPDDELVECFLEGSFSESSSYLLASDTTEDYSGYHWDTNYPVGFNIGSDWKVNDYTETVSSSSAYTNTVDLFVKVAGLEVLRKRLIDWEESFSSSSDYTYHAERPESGPVVSTWTRNYSRTRYNTGDGYTVFACDLRIPTLFGVSSSVSLSYDVSKSENESAHPTTYYDVVTDYGAPSFSVVIESGVLAKTLSSADSLQVTDQSSQWGPIIPSDPGHYSAGEAFYTLSFPPRAQSTFTSRGDGLFAIESQDCWYWSADGGHSTNWSDLDGTGAPRILAVQGVYDAQADAIIELGDIHPDGIDPGGGNPDASFTFDMVPWYYGEATPAVYPGVAGYAMTHANTPEI